MTQQPKRIPRRERQVQATQQTDYDDYNDVAQSRRYRRPRRQISWVGVILGLAIGLIGGLVWAWEISPMTEYDTEPWQLAPQAKSQYVVAIMLRYSQDGDLGRAAQALFDLRYPNDPIQAVADIACQLATSSYVNNASGLRAVRSLMAFYQPQGRTGCADTLISPDDVAPTSVIEFALPTNTPTLPAPETKTPTALAPVSATSTPFVFIVPTSPPQSDFIFVNATTFCDADNAGVIQVNIYQLNGSTGIPGQAVRVRWDTGENTFFTGLKPNSGAGFADFQMEADRSYIVDMPRRSDPVPQPLVAVACTTPDGRRATISYRVIFRAIQ